MNLLCNLLKKQGSAGMYERQKPLSFQNSSILSRVIFAGLDMLYLHKCKGFYDE